MNVHTPAPGIRERDMVMIPGGEYTMGSDHHYPEEAPAHRVAVDGFWMDRAPVTNHQYAEFVAATGHITLAERPPDPADYPGALPELLVPASTVFTPPGRRVDLSSQYHWWRLVPGADWRHPRGPGSSIDELHDHPVVHVAWEDIVAYASWAGADLPTEAEWERAARGGLDGAEYAWGDVFSPAGRPMANTWQGDFPLVNELLDGYAWTSPVGAYPANGYGLHDMIGNVWEWTLDWFQTHAPATRSCCAISNPRGGVPERSHDPSDPVPVPRKVIKGGSHLCAPNYCRRYRPAARTAHPIDTAISHLGFRCIRRSEGGGDR